MFPCRIATTDPVVVKRKELPNKDFTFEHIRVQGDFFLVIPRCAQEVFFLQMLGKNIDVFVPSAGEGLLVRSKCLNGLFVLPD